jgi:hypothetical protein
MLQPTYPDFPCEAKGSSIMTKTNQLKNEELFCNSNPERGNTLTWMKIQAADKTEMSVAKPKLTSVTCVKGKLIKRLTAISPKCPSGYKKK